MFLSYVVICLLCQEMSVLPDQATGQVLSVQAAHRHAIQAITFVGGHGTVAIHQRGEAVELFAGDRGKMPVLHALEATRAKCVAFAASGDKCAFFRGCRIELWDLGHNVMERSLPFSDAAIPPMLALSADGRFVAVVVDTPTTRFRQVPNGIEAFTSFSVHVVSIASGNTIASLKGYMGPAGPIAFSNSGKMLGVGTAPVLGNDAAVFVWDVTTGTRLAELRGHAETCSSVAFSPDDKILATASGFKGPGVVQLWNASTWKRVRELRGHFAGVSCLAFSPVGNILASGGKELILWDVASGENVTRPGPQIALWDSLADRPRVAREAIGIPVNSIAFSTDGKTLAAGGINGVATLWDVESLLNRKEHK